MVAPRASNNSIAYDGLLNAFTTGARVLVAVLGGLYTVGLLIVNIDLARYGVSNLDLARPEYAMAGAFWALAMLPSGILIVVFIRWLRERLGRRERVYAFFIGLLGVVAAIGIPVLLLDTFSVRQEDPFRVDGSEVLVRHVIAVLLNGAAVWVIVYIVDLLRRDFLESETSFKVLFGGLGALFVVPVLSVALLSYAVLSFPLVARQLGGGHKTIVEVILSEPAPDSWDRLGIPISADRSLIGPVALLFESQSGLVVARWVAPWFRLQAAEELITVIAPRADSVAIERKSIAGIIYKGARISE